MTKRLILCDDSKVEEVSEKAKKHGFGIEVQALHNPQISEDENQINFHNKIIKNINPISFHAAFADLCPWSSDPMVREVARNRFEIWYNAALKINATHMVFHIGRVPGAGVPKKRADRCIEFRNKFLEWKSEEMNYYIENLFDQDPEMLSLIIDGIDRKNVKVCLDTGHAHCKSKIPVEDRITTLKDRIWYVHIHDNHWENDEHLGIGKGNINMIKVLAALNKYSPNAIWTLECNVEDMDESIERLQKNKFL